MTFFTNKTRDTTEAYNSCKQQLMILARFWLFFSSVKKQRYFCVQNHHALGWRWQQQETGIRVGGWNGQPAYGFFRKGVFTASTTRMFWSRYLFLKLTVLQFDLRRTLPNGRLLLVQLDSIVFDDLQVYLRFFFCVDFILATFDSQTIMSFNLSLNIWICNDTDDQTKRTTFNYG